MPDTPIFQAHGLHKRFQQGSLQVHALRGIDLRIDAGEFVVIAGPSGSGKSTLLNLLGLLDSPSEGQLSFAGRDVSRLSATELSGLRRDSLGFVFQAYNLMPVLSALENTEMVMEFQGIAPEQRRERSIRLLQQLGLGEQMHRYPDQLSGGQQQRVAVARAIASGPRVVIADEPTANLDSATAIALMELMQSLNREQGVSFVFSSHDPLVIQRARRVILLRDGKLVSDQAQDPIERPEARERARRDGEARHALA
ncbi:ABC transporter ATP-binding protein [Paucibacter sp. DJ2R-2]|uniref:ABC transporter ATP-binding protein n=1 Tax=Paucibacter sp. DJ2R-2 TaxID=2893558 RepID=UPI0021E4F042|nr:ABC transporter ATP-binding protein [Paucibacter sp. DJ2R-2]MCV2423441.1 ABC transporter ATP-binding protein [Paucibacter sp. DJ4R-1]MCV2441318.1 ABC transporter ATP-binding protein [Paucibacter sp. DJ2R-2]